MYIIKTVIIRQQQYKINGTILRVYSDKDVYHRELSGVITFVSPTKVDHAIRIIITNRRGKNTYKVIYERIRNVPDMSVYIKSSAHTYTSWEDFVFEFPIVEQITDLL